MADTLYRDGATVEDDNYENRDEQDTLVVNGAEGAVQVVLGPHVDEPPTLVQNEAGGMSIAPSEPEAE